MIDIVEYFRKRGKLVYLDESLDHINERMYRASPFVKCEVCKEHYRDHPYVENCLGMDERPYLHYLCNGDVVKL